jgi:hypothetical protein
MTMSTELKREERYIVFKLSDVERFLTDADRAHLAMMKNEIDAGRDCANKPPFKGLIVESDWPEYEPTWKAIEARVTEVQPAPSVPEDWKEGVEAVAAMLQKKADDYAEEYGYDDMGVLSFGEGMCGQIKMDYYTNLIELTEEVRAMLTATTEAKP